jgi:dTDP-4-amino-4,6-dideoxygalactose transaminase
VKRDKLQKYLAEQGVQTLIHYPLPPHKQDAYHEWANESYPLTEQIHSEVLSLPMGPMVENLHLDAVSKAVNSL